MYSMHKGSLLRRIYNVLTKKVLATDVADIFLSMREAGNAKYCEFVSENLLGSKSITIKKRNYQPSQKIVRTPS